MYLIHLFFVKQIPVNPFITIDLFNATKSNHPSSSLPVVAPATPWPLSDKIFPFSSKKAQS